MTKGLRKYLAAAAGLAVAGTVGIALAQGDPLSARKQHFKMAAEAMKATKAVIDAGGPTAQAVPEAEKIVQMARTNAGNFPAGSNQGETKAKAEIWTNRAEFDKLFVNLQNQAVKLVDVAKAGDVKALGAQFGQVGGACKACHDEYRAK